LGEHGEDDPDDQQRAHHGERAPGDLALEGGPAGLARHRGVGRGDRRLGLGAHTATAAGSAAALTVAAAMTRSGVASSAERTAVARPWLSTSTRWLIPSTSGSSEEAR